MCVDSKSLCNMQRPPMTHVKVMHQTANQKQHILSQPLCPLVSLSTVVRILEYTRLCTRSAQNSKRSCVSGVIGALNHLHIHFPYFRSQSYHQSLWSQWTERSRCYYTIRIKRRSRQSFAAPWLYSSNVLLADSNICRAKTQSGYSRTKKIGASLCRSGPHQDSVPYLVQNTSGNVFRHSLLFLIDTHVGLSVTIAP